jgi:hypothetical protein
MENIDKLSVSELQELIASDSATEINKNMAWEKLMRTGIGSESLLSEKKAPRISKKSSLLKIGKKSR